MKNDSLKKGFEQIGLVYWALIGGQLLFGGAVLFLLYSGEFGMAQGDEAFFAYLIPAVSISAIFGAYMIQNRRNASAAFLSDLSEKVTHYRMTLIICSAIIEGANLLAIVATLLTGNLYYMLYLLIGLVVILLFRPSKENFKNIYRVSREEAAEL